MITMLISIEEHAGKVRFSLDPLRRQATEPEIAMQTLFTEAFTSALKQEGKNRRVAWGEWQKRTKP